LVEVVGAAAVDFFAVATVHTCAAGFVAMEAGLREAVAQKAKTLLVSVGDGASKAALEVRKALLRRGISQHSLHGGAETNPRYRRCCHYPLPELLWEKRAKLQPRFRGRTAAFVHHPKAPVSFPQHFALAALPEAE
jgi:hypothetical protein